VKQKHFKDLFSVSQKKKQEKVLLRHKK